jgi:glycosyltransferase involved in cell wall biosynthesis
MSYNAQGKNNESLMVSICCITYNHEKYISNTLKGFLMQKTNFKYEILIHDDASIDNTAKIISEYEDKYPEIIKPIYQTENQYSKNIKISINYNFPRAKGKYIAICEGDDYWIDPLKLQKQVDYIEAHPECSLCTHAAELLSFKNKLIGKVRPHFENKSYSVEEVIAGGGALFPTNSMLFPAALVKKMPNFYMNAPIGDYPLSIFLALKGDVYYIDSCMSVYRYMAEGSWSRKMAMNPQAKIENAKKLNNMLGEIDHYTKHKYTQAINEKILLNDFTILINSFNIKELKLAKYNKYYSKFSIKQRAFIHFGAYFPCVVTFWRSLRLKWLC